MGHEISLPFKRQSHKMVKHTQTVRRQIADELFECIWPFYGIGAYELKKHIWIKLPQRLQAFLLS